MRKIGLIIAGIIVILGIVGAVQYVGYHNSWTEIDNKYDAQLDNNKVIYDEVWKVIKQQAGVTERYAEDFRNNYVAIMESRNYGGELMKWIQESNPNFDQSMYQQLMNTIDTERTKFTANQKLLISYHQQMKNMKEKFPSNVFLMGKMLPELVTVTSTKTEETFESRQENDVDVF